MDKRIFQYSAAVMTTVLFLVSCTPAKAQVEFNYSIWKTVSAGIMGFLVPSWKAAVVEYCDEAGANCTDIADVLTDGTIYSLIDGTRDFTAVVGYDGNKTFSTDTDIVSKKYVDDAITAGGGYTDEDAQDAIGAALVGTETLIDVSYDDPNGEYDFVVENDLSLFDNTTSAFITGADNAATATALAANGGNCSAGSAPLGVDAAGAVESCFDVWTEAENTSAGYTSYSDSDIDGSETAFDGWDKDASNDFDGAFSSLSGVSIATTHFAAATLVIESEGIASNDNDTTIPTSAAVKDYADSNDDTGTDDQTIDTFTLSTNTISLSLEDDGEAAKTIDISSATAVAANTAKVTNATHTGEVTGSGALTIADDIIEAANLETTNTLDDNDIITVDTTSGGFTGLTCAEITGSADLCDGTDDGGTETNALESDGASGIADTEIPIGTGAGTVNYAALSGDVTMTNAGAVTIADEAVSLAKMAHMATASFLGRNTAATGDVEVLSASTARSILNVDNGADVTQTYMEGVGVNTIDAGDDLVFLDDDAFDALKKIDYSDFVTGLSIPTDEVGTLTTGDLCVNDGSAVNCTVNTIAELETALDATDILTSTEGDAAYEPLGVAAADITDITANGTSLITAANYAAMRTLLDLEAGTDFYSISAADAAFQPLEATLTDIADGTIAENLVNTANPWADSEVANDITASNYLPLAGGTLTGEVVVDNLGLEFTAGDDFTDCSAFSATGGGIFFDDSEGIFKKCEDNTLTDLDTGGGLSADAVGTSELDDDANTPTAGDFVVVETGAASFDYVTPNAGTDVTADLEEESHGSEHLPGGDDAIFPADPDADALLYWDDAGGAIIWALFSDIEDYFDTLYAAISHTHAASDITSGTLAHEQGGLEADVSGYTNGLYGMISGVTADIDTEAELYSALSDVSLFLEDFVDDTSPTAGGDLDMSTFDILLDAIPNSDDTSSGIKISVTVDTNALGVGACLYLNTADGHWDTTDADAAGTSDCQAMALQTSTGTKEVLLSGTMRNDTWAFASAGLPVYVSTTLGDVTTTAPSGSGDCVKKIGVTQSDDEIIFSPVGDIACLE